MNCVICNKDIIGVSGGLTQPMFDRTYDFYLKCKNDYEWCRVLKPRCNICFKGSGLVSLKKN